MLICGVCMSELMKIDSDAVMRALRDPGLLYPMIEAAETIVSCGQFLMEYGSFKSGHHESFAADSLRILRHLQDRDGLQSISRIPYSATRTLLVRIWCQVRDSIPPHLLTDNKLVDLCFRWLESSPVKTGGDRQFLIRLIKNQRRQFSSEIEYNLVLLSLFFRRLMESEKSRSDSDVYCPENLQFILPLLDQESLALCLYAALENLSTEEILFLWSLLISLSPMSPSAEPCGVHFSKSTFEGSQYPLFPFANIVIRVVAKIGSSKSLNWRVVVETMLRMVSGKLSQPILITDACELLVYFLKLEVPGRHLPSLLLAGGDKDMLPPVACILEFAESIFNRLTVGNENSLRNPASSRQLEFLSSLIRTLQEDLLVVKSGHAFNPKSSLLSVQMASGPLEFARLQSIGIKPCVSAITAPVLPGDTNMLLQRLPPVQGVVLADQVYVPPVSVAPTALAVYPTGQGTEVPFRSQCFAGIQNFNNTCYLSSFLQMLFLTDGLACQIYGFNLEKKEKTEEADFVQGTKIVSGLQLLFARLLKTNHKYIEISEFIRSLPPSYRSGEQQDVTESGRWLFDKMGGTDQPLVKSVFGGEMIHKTKCSGCNNVTERKEDFTDLCVSVPKEAEVLGKKRVTVQSLIKRMLKPESLTGDNKYSCDTCGRKQEASRWIELTQLPNHLMLVMHKFSFDIKTCDFKKETTPVHCDDGAVDLIGTRYELYGAVLHYGESAMKGHYVALGKRSGQSSDRNSQWALLDDSNVTMLSESEAMERISGLHKPSDSAYVLYFKSVRAPPANAIRMPQQIVDQALAVEAAAVHL